jgi:uncharacterized protein YegP (UPF0339 family)
MTTKRSTQGFLTITAYQAKDGWRWRATRGGRIVADSGEAYASRRNALRAASSLVMAIATARAQIVYE